MEARMGAPHLLQKRVLESMVAPQELQNAIKKPRAYPSEIWGKWIDWREYTADCGVMDGYRTLVAAKGLIFAK